MNIDSFSLGIIIITSLVLLATKDLAMINDTRFSARLSKYLNIPILVMVWFFAMLLVLGVMKILQTGT